MKDARSKTLASYLFASEKLQHTTAAYEDMLRQMRNPSAFPGGLSLAVERSKARADGSPEPMSLDDAMFQLDILRREMEVAKMIHDPEFWKHNETQHRADIRATHIATWVIAISSLGYFLVTIIQLIWRR